MSGLPTPFLTDADLGDENDFIETDVYDNLPTLCWVCGGEEDEFGKCLTPFCDRCQDEDDNEPYGVSAAVWTVGAQLELNRERARRLEVGEPLMTAGEIEDFIEKRGLNGEA